MHFLIDNCVPKKSSKGVNNFINNTLDNNSFYIITERKPICIIVLYLVQVSLNIHIFISVNVCEWLNNIKK